MNVRLQLKKMNEDTLVKFIHESSFKIFNLFLVFFYLSLALEATSSEEAWYYWKKLDQYLAEEKTMIDNFILSYSNIALYLLNQGATDNLKCEKDLKKLPKVIPNLDSQFFFIITVKFLNQIDLTQGEQKKEKQLWALDHFQKILTLAKDKNHSSILSQELFIKEVQ